MQIDTQTIANHSRAAILEIGTIHKNITGKQFAAARDFVRSKLGLEKADANKCADAINYALRAEIKAQIKSSLAARLEGFTALTSGGKETVRLTADGSVRRFSVPYTKAGTDAETVAACKLVLAKPAPDANASEGARAQYHAKQRHATITLCRLDPDFALADAQAKLKLQTAYISRLEKEKAEKEKARLKNEKGVPATSRA